ncbi:MAG: hypothetical protein GWN58_63635, partial [Anaerolineae bacterium]|nr:hypothetical protein [Anaerolineae bacterium]
RTREGPLARGGKQPQADAGPLDWLLPTASPLERALYSPFDPQTRMGTVSLVPDQGVIAGRIVDTSVFAMMLMGLQMVVLGIAIVIVVIRHITRPIARISHKLHSLAAESGEKLPLPRDNE